jgi:excisionase family DNA binding protein
MIAKTLARTQLPIRRGLSEIEAATYISVSPTFFRQLVRDGRMPRPRLAGRRRLWDIDELDAAFRDLPREGVDGQPAPESSDDSTWADFE